MGQAPFDGEMKMVTGQRTDRRDQPAFTSKAQRGSEGTRAALEAPEYELGIANAGQESCTVSDNRLVQNGTLRPSSGLGWRTQSLCLLGGMPTDLCC
jgi:hypothetical protein